MTAAISQLTPPRSTAAHEDHRARDRHRHLWLVAGAALALLAVHGRWDVAVAAWLSPALLLRFTRTGNTVAVVLGMWVSNVAAAAFFVAESALGFGPATLLGGVALGSVLTLPYLADRFLAQRGGPAARLLVFPLARVACEFLLFTVGPLGMVYGSLATTQHANLALLQIVSVTGSYGVSFLLCAFATVTNLVWERRRLDSRGVLIAGGYAATVVAVLVGGELRLALTHHAGPSVRVVGIGPSAAAEARSASMLAGVHGHESIALGDPALVRPALQVIDDDLLAATRVEARAGARIVVWPENGARIRAGDQAAFLAEASATAREEHIYLEMGILVYPPQAPYGRDETDLIGPDGTRLWTYQKAHPIPGMESYRPGPSRLPTARTPYGLLSNAICYDADFPQLMRAPADIMLVPSGDWPQYARPHTERAELRAIENGYTLVRQDHGGVSAVFDGYGRTLATSSYPETDRQTVVAYVATRGAGTLYTHIGDTFAWLCIATLVLLIGSAAGRSRRRSAA